MGIKPINGSKTVTTAGTRVQLVTTGTYVTSVYFEALRTNTGNIYVGTDTVSSTVYMAKLAAGEGFCISIDSSGRVGSSSGGSEININTIYFDSQNSGEKVLYTYLERTGSY